MTENQRTWRAPGAGEWARDDAHQPRSLTGFVSEVFISAQLRGFSRGFAETGSMLAGFDAYTIAGRPYLRPIIAGAPKLPIWGEATPPRKVSAPKPPPAAIFKLLFFVHPEFRRRARAAERLWATRPWREVCRRWHEEQRPAVVKENLAFTRTDVTAVTDAVLAEHLGSVTRGMRTAIEEHFFRAPYICAVIGDLLVKLSQWTGASPAEIVGVLRGASPASREGADDARRIADALAGDSALRALLSSDRPTAEIVAALGTAPGPVGAAVKLFLEHHGHRLFTGVDIDSHTLVEVPELVVRTLRAALDTNATQTDSTAAELLASLRARTRAEHHAELAELYEEARKMYQVRDDDSGLMTWRFGLVRRAVLEAGERLTRRGALEATEHALDATVSELVGLLKGAKGPTATEVAARAALRAENDSVAPPRSLGEASPPPSPDVMPPATARLLRATLTFLSALHGEETVSGGGLRGAPASPGVYEGRARIVLDAGDFSKLEPGDVLVARATSPAYNTLLPLTGAIVTARGGVLCHAALVAREYGIPAVVGVPSALEELTDGCFVRVDGDRGVVERIETLSVSRNTHEIDIKTIKSAPEKIARAAPETRGRAVVLSQAGDGTFGGKARSLAVALGAGLRVPDGVALDADLVELVALGDGDAIETVQKACAGVASPWAVRSSAADEDSTAASFAGQHTTVLGVTPESLTAAIATVHASGQSEGAMAYRAKMNITGPVRMAVVVQSLVRAEVAGVMFCRDPTRSDDSRLIEATWGLGESLVSGLVTPDRYCLHRDGTVLERTIGLKDLAIDARPDSGTSQVEIAPARATAACLDDARLRELSALAHTCEALFESAQDLEWAIADGKLFLLQSRPQSRAPVVDG